MNNKNTCSDHQKIIEFICFDCEAICCGRCILKHKLHNFDHIEEITQSIITESSSNINNNEKDDNSNNFIYNKLENLWSTIKSQAQSYQQLQTTENEISNYFKDIFSLLILEEHKLKKPIVNEKDILEGYITSNIDEIKSLNLIVNQVKNNDNEFNSKSNNDPIDDNSSSSSNSTLDQEDIADTKDKYHIESIIKSINDSDSLDQLIYMNKNTLFNTVLQSQDDSVLDSIIFHLKKYRGIQAQTKNYRLRANTNGINQVKNSIKEIFRLTEIKKYQQPNNFYLLLANRSFSSEPLCLTDINDPERFITEKIKLSNDFGGYWRINSVIAIGQYVYRFDTAAYQRLAIKSKEIDIDNSISGVESLNNPSVCQDHFNSIDQDCIYIFDGNSFDSTRVIQFDLKSLEFKLYHMLDNIHDSPLYSFYYGDHIYYLDNSSNLIKFDLLSKTTQSFSLDYVVKYNSSICTDGNGNIYVHYSDTFFTVNINTMESRYLQACHSYRQTQLVYHKDVTNHEAETSYIYMILGGAENYKYSIGEDNWTEFLENYTEYSEFSANVLIQY